MTDKKKLSAEELASDLWTDLRITHEVECGNADIRPIIEEIVSHVQIAMQQARIEALEEAIEVAEIYDVTDANFSPYQVQADICSRIRALIQKDRG